MCRKCRKTHKHTQTIHPNNQPTKETKRDANQQTTKQTNKHPHTHLHKHPDNKTSRIFLLQTANTNTNCRGRVLAEGDVDPAAGSRDEPTRLPVEVPFEGLRNKYTRALFFESNNWVQALPQDFYRDPPLPTFTHTATVIFRAFSHESPKNENKRPQPQSDRASAVQTLFATFYKNSKYHQNTPRRAPQSDVF